MVSLEPLLCKEWCCCCCGLAPDSAPEDRCDEPCLDDDDDDDDDEDRWWVEVADAASSSSSLCFVCSRLLLRPWDGRLGPDADAAEVPGAARREEEEPWIHARACAGARRPNCWKRWGSSEASVEAQELRPLLSPHLKPRTNRMEMLRQQLLVLPPTEAAAIRTSRRNRRWLQRPPRPRSPRQGRAAASPTTVKAGISVQSIQQQLRRRSSRRRLKEGDAGRGPSWRWTG